MTHGKTLLLKGSRAKRRRSPRLGMALLVVVVLVMLISLGAYRFSFYMESQYRVTRSAQEQVHARLAAMSGLEVATAIVELPLSQRTDLGGLDNNESAFRDILVSDVPLSLGGERDPNAWRFCLVSPQGNQSVASNRTAATSTLGGSSGSIRFGLENESAKLHIPTLLAWDRMKPGHARAALLGLPGATEGTVDAWLLSLGATRRIETQAAGNESVTLDDVRQAWLGGDLNQNYQLDPLERRLVSQSKGGPNSRSARDRSLTEAVAFSPLQRYLTWYSGHRNTTRNGAPRINLNDTDLAQLHRNLSAIWPADRANFVIAMRQYGPGSDGLISDGPRSDGPSVSPSKPTDPSPATQTVAQPGPALSTQATAAPTGTAPIEWVQGWSPDFSKSSLYTFRSALDLVGAVVNLPPTISSSGSSGSTGSSSRSGATTSAKRFVRSPFSSDLSEMRNYLSNLLDDVAVDLSPTSIGRVDVSAAPFEVLAGVPGLDLTLAQQIVQYRSGAADANKTEDGANTIAWLVNAMDIAKLKELEPYLSSRSDVYSVQSIGYRDDRSAVYRITATIDGCETPTQLRNPMVWHPWDRGFSLEQLVGATR